ncbi:hypothetical protein DIPPA_21696 [Diplonema papillatum]|nr:hypothetical protein DIPPA_21696 [Diplonema papillatum]|eukprot:gene13489-20783_t
MVIARGRTAGGPPSKRIEAPPSARSAPYSARKPSIPRARPGLISHEEVEFLLEQDRKIALFNEKIAVVKEKMQNSLQRFRNELDQCKQEVRGPKLNGEALAAVEREADRRIEEVKVLILGRIADDKAMWQEGELDAEMAAKEETLKASSIEMQARHDTAKAKYVQAKRETELVDAEMRNLKDEVTVVQEKTVTLQKEMYECEGKKAVLINERDAARNASEAKANEASAVLNEQETTASELASADKERCRMVAHVNKLSNNIRGFVLLPRPVANVAINQSLASSKMTDLDVTLGTSDKALHFELDHILQSLAELPTILQPQVEASSKTLLIFPPATPTQSPAFPEELLTWASRCLPSPTVTVVELYAEQARDLLADDDYQEKALCGGSLGHELEVVEGKPAFKAVTVGSAGDVVRAAKNLVKREEKGVLRGGQAVVAQFKSGGKQLAVVIPPSAPSKADDNQLSPHVVNCLARMSSDAKEGKAMLKRSVVGRFVHQLIPDASLAAVCAVGTPSSTPQSVTDACRALHRIMMVDLGVSKEKN